MKNIILCFDGTENKFGPAPYTNLLKVFRMLEKDDATAQISYYQPGIGTTMGVEGYSLADGLESVQRSLDSMIASSLDSHIINAYKYLMKFYEQGDKIYLFGFRGAFAARVLCSMIQTVGLLHDGLEELAEGAWNIYSTWEYAAQPSQPDYTTTLVDEFKKTFSRSVSPEVAFLGLFDCVNSVGWIRDRMFPFTSRLSQVKQIRHAISLDERRGKYKQQLIFPLAYPQHFIPSTNTTFTTNSSIYSISRSSKGSTKISLQDSHNSHSKLSETRKMMKDLEDRILIASKIKPVKYPRPSSMTSFDIDKAKLISGEFQEVWFAGNHGDVGGGWDSDSNGQFISNLSLRWMIAEAINNGVIFQKDTLSNFAERYSSLDSLLSCQHDVLNFFSYGLTHTISSSDRTKILDLSNELFQKSSVPYFRSCESSKNKSFDELFSNGVYLNSLNRLNFDSSNREIPNIFAYYRKLPSNPIRGLDGRGNNPFFSTLLWWLIELIPLGTKIEDCNCQWRNVYYPNLGRSRVLPIYARLHWSVYWRMKYCFDYTPLNIPSYSKSLLANNKNYKHSNDLDSNTENAIDNNCQFDNPSDNDDIDFEILRHVKEETEELLKIWDEQDWKQVPDDLAPFLQD